ncbi:MAG: CDGSH iron-sulfur domain-containing protein [Candidatus Eremiobacteraeota bacterium]|nr:CDGSH iron-sulfur domain-containing protein [Candidatus Eremiobacteraeota bacterium]
MRADERRGSGPYFGTKATYIRTHFEVPGEIEEAAAALQDVCEKISALTRRGAGTERAVLQDLERSQGIAIAPERNGPYLATNVTTMTNSKGETLATRTEMALCRCGGSQMKPYCDGTHARIGFSGDKDPARTRDHRTDYVRADGLTIHDNRGTCCHSGNCTDKLPSVFRTNKEPFVDPEGASQQQIIDIVSQCPSGALSYTLHSIEFRDRDRAPNIYVSKDGPYHVLGRINLRDEVLGEGASNEHYALCRCGHSKNKPFCDGSHWYAKFVDEKN